MSFNWIWTLTILSLLLILKIMKFKLLCKWAIIYFNKCEFKHMKQVQGFGSSYLLIWRQLVISAGSPSVNLWAESFRCHLCSLAAIHSFQTPASPPPNTHTSCNAASSVFRSHRHTLRRWLCLDNADTQLTLLLQTIKDPH